ncbi:hypothetical protein P280DRAFT_162669 [Massarina eburnea CBS 473.64]|uniref:Uncharacterized protein n=1 Tax=Massarina eburnea CBS 473.64 TaxID=1395130 RepID=A0A6A6RLG6_9PLEO|nr:hypothetical protein P280DRAFT_162669 [Massarina eburnea CBS 473.64]
MTAFKVAGNKWRNTECWVRIWDLCAYPGGCVHVEASVAASLEANLEARPHHRKDEVRRISQIRMRRTCSTHWLEREGAALACGDRLDRHPRTHAPTGSAAAPRTSSVFLDRLVRDAGCLLCQPTIPGRRGQERVGGHGGWWWCWWWCWCLRETARWWTSGGSLGRLPALAV